MTWIAWAAGFPSLVAYVAVMRAEAISQRVVRLRLAHRRWLAAHPGIIWHDIVFSVAHTFHVNAGIWYGRE